MKKILLISTMLISLMSQATSPKLLNVYVGISKEKEEQTADIRDAVIAKALNLGGSNNLFLGLYKGLGTNKGSQATAFGIESTSVKPLHELLELEQEPSNEPSTREIMIRASQKQRSPKYVSRSDTIQRAYKIMNAHLEFFATEKVEPITTALTALIEERADGPVLYLAWVGNSRAMLLNEDGTVAYETQDHTTDNKTEKDRLPKTPSGKSITRALGAKVERTDKGISKTTIPTPEIARINLKPKHKAVILASDGFWNKVKSEDAAEYAVKRLEQFPNANDNKHTALIADELADKALKEKNIDSVTVIVVQFIWEKTPPASTQVKDVHPPQKAPAPTRTRNLPLSQVMNNIEQRIPEEYRPKYNKLFQEISSTLNKKSLNHFDYIWIESTIETYLTKTPIDQIETLSLLSLLQDIFSAMSLSNPEKAERIINEHNLLSK